MRSKAPSAAEEAAELSRSAPQASRLRAVRMPHQGSARALPRPGAYALDLGVIQRADRARPLDRLFELDDGGDAPYSTLDQAAQFYNTRLQEEATARNAVMKHSEDWETALRNARKNRYTNIWPYERTQPSRLFGARLPRLGYFNGNITFLNRRMFLITQAPVRATFYDFWSVVAGMPAAAIVNVTRFVDDNRPKAERYWPVYRSAEDDPLYGESVDSTYTSIAYEMTFQAMAIRQGQMFLQYTAFLDRARRSVSEEQMEWNRRDMTVCEDEGLTPRGSGKSSASLPECAGASGREGEKERGGEREPARGPAKGQAKGQAVARAHAQPQLQSQAQAPACVREPATSAPSASAAAAPAGSQQPSCDQPPKSHCITLRTESLRVIEPHFYVYGVSARQAPTTRPRSASSGSSESARASPHEYTVPLYYYGLWDDFAAPANLRHVYLLCLEVLSVLDAPAGCGGPGAQASSSAPKSQQLYSAQQPRRPSQFAPSAPSASSASPAPSAPSAPSLPSASTASTASTPAPPLRPIVVHCSAGVGRSSTFAICLAITEMLVDMRNRGVSVPPEDLGRVFTHLPLKIHTMVDRVRIDRNPICVQTAEQFCFLHEYCNFCYRVINGIEPDAE